MYPFLILLGVVWVLILLTLFLHMLTKNRHVKYLPSVLSLLYSLCVWFFDSGEILGPQLFGVIVFVGAVLMLMLALLLDSEVFE